MVDHRAYIMASQLNVHNNWELHSTAGSFYHSFNNKKLKKSIQHLNILAAEF